MPAYYVGLMSGTSVDGIDAALVDFDTSPPTLVAAQMLPWPTELQRRITHTIEQHRNISLEELGQLDSAIGIQLAAAARAIIEKSSLKAALIEAIGSHGQTLFHAPDGTNGFSMQAGDPNRIAEETGITTVADFRRRDIAAGGQGAPLVPAFHQTLFYQPGRKRVILNIGGIANITVLAAHTNATTGFDTGPGNILLDSWFRKHHGKGFDRNGDWGSSGRLHRPLLDELLAHPFFLQPPPKSTGRETFHLNWLEQVLDRIGSETIQPQDVQRTLAEFTAASITLAIQQYAENTEQVLVCGGGIHNHCLMRRLETMLSPRAVESTTKHGLHPDWIEAVAFAWLAKQTLEDHAGNLPAVTGARHPVILGAIYPGRR